MGNYSVKGSIVIKTTAPKIWDVLTNPARIVLYIGAQTHTNWVVGSPVTWEGEMHGTKFINKGTVLENVPNKVLRFTYWSGMGGDKDLPENYSEITYTIQELDDDSAELTYSRIKIPTQIEQQIFEGQLQFMLEAIKNIAEG